VELDVNMTGVISDVIPSRASDLKKKKMTISIKTKGEIRCSKRIYLAFPVQSTATVIMQSEVHIVFDVCFILFLLLFHQI